MQGRDGDFFVFPLRVFPGEDTPMEKVSFSHGELILVAYQGEGGPARIIAIQEIAKIMGCRL